MSKARSPNLGFPGEHDPCPKWEPQEDQRESKLFPRRIIKQIPIFPIHWWTQLQIQRGPEEVKTRVREAYH